MGTHSIPLSSIIIGGSTFGAVLGPSTTAVTDTGLATAALTTYSIFTSTGTFINPTNSATILSTFTSTVTDPAVYSSLSAAEASSLSAKTHTQSSAHASSTSSSAPTSGKSSSNLSTLILAVVVPVAVVLIATFAAFWFYMRRRHRRDLNNQPAFIMAAKTEKLTSTANSVASDHEDRGPHIETWIASSVSSHTTEKPRESAQVRELSPRPSKSLSRSPPNFSRGHVAVGRTSNVREEQRPVPMLTLSGADSFSPFTPHVPSFATNTSPTKNYNNEMIRSANPHLAPLASSNSGPQVRSNISGRGPPAAVGTSNHVLTRNRSKSLSSTRGGGSNQPDSNMNYGYHNGPPSIQRPPTAPNSGFRGPSPPRNMSPNHNRAPPPAPITTQSARLSAGFINQPLYSPIIRETPKIKRPSVIVPPSQNGGISYVPHTSPLLPSPHSDNRRDHNLTAENLRIARLANTSRLGFGSPEPDHVSEISVEEEEAAADAKSDVSSMNEQEKFNFERDTRASDNGSMLGTIPGGRSSEYVHGHNPIVGPGYESSWR